MKRRKVSENYCFVTKKCMKDNHLTFGFRCGSAKDTTWMRAGIWIDKKDWSDRRKTFSRSCPEDIVKECEKTIALAHSLRDELDANGTTYDSQQWRDLFLRRVHVDEKTNDLLDSDVLVLHWFQKRINRLENDIREVNGTIKDHTATIVNYTTVTHSIEKFCNEIGSDPNHLAFSDVNSDWLVRFLNFNKRNGLLHGNTGNLRGKYIYMKTIFRDADINGVQGINMKIFELPEVKKVLSFRPKKREMQVVSPETIQKLIYFQPSHKWGNVFDRQLYIDMYLFAYYASGLSPVDIHNLKVKDIVGNEIKTYRSKCSERQPYVPLNAMSRKLIEKYKGISKNGYIFPILDNIKDPTPKKLVMKTFSFLRAQRHYLKKVSETLGVPTIRINSARHSFATHLLEKGGTSVDIATCLGNTIEMVDKSYLHPDEKIIDRKLEKLYCELG